MDNIDNRIVNLQFNNKDFEKNAATTLETCEKLDKQLSFKSIRTKASAARSMMQGFSSAKRHRLSIMATGSRTSSRQGIRSVTLFQSSER